MRDSICYIFFCWFFQILTWGMLIYLIVSIMSDTSKNYYPILFFVLSYLVYLILEFCSSVSKYICHKTTQSGIYQKMGTYYRTYPVFQFYCECYITKRGDEK